MKRLMHKLEFAIKNAINEAYEHDRIQDTLDWMRVIAKDYHDELSGIELTEEDAQNVIDLEDEYHYSTYDAIVAILDGIVEELAD